MTLSVIGAGFGRTGTMSLKLALEALGLGPCHHMLELIQNPDQVGHWVRAFDGEPMDWAAALKGYRSAVDWPSCHFWRELADAYPEAKVVLTVRDAQTWFDSTQATIFAPQLFDGPMPPFAAVARRIGSDVFSGRQNERDHAIAVFEAHNAAVRAALPPERLLVYEVSQGWEPLCAHLGVPVPETPFPKTNSTEEFVARRESIKAGAAH